MSRTHIRRGLVSSGAALAPPPSPSYSAEAEALFARFTVPPDTTRKNNIDALIVTLIAAGIWTKLDVLYVTAAADAQAGQRNWKADAFNLSEVNSPTFTADRGYASNGTTSYLDLAWDITNNGVNYTQNSASYGVWCNDNIANSNSVFGFSTANNTRITPRVATDNFGYRINQVAIVQAANTSSIGLFVATRSGANATQAYKDGAAHGSAGAEASATTSFTVDWNIGRVNTVFNPMQVGAAFTGANLSSGENTALYNALLAYMQAVGNA